MAVLGEHSCIYLLKLSGRQFGAQFPQLPLFPICSPKWLTAVEHHASVSFLALPAFVHLL